MKVINFCGSAGAGKSTAAYGLAHAMKQRYIEVELVDEYAKKLILAQSNHMLADQLTILAEQNSRLYYASLEANQIDYAVTDSPIFLSAFYAPASYPNSFKKFVIDMFNQYDNINIFLERNHPYSEKRREQTETESDLDSIKMKEMLKVYNIPFITMKAGNNVPEDVLKLIGF